VSYHGRQQYDSRRWHIRGAREPRTTVGNANYTIKAWDKVVALTALLTTDRTWTLPAANSVPPGHQILVLDEIGAIGGNELGIVPTGTDTINRGDPGIGRSFTDAFLQCLFVSDGSSNWSFAPHLFGMFNNALVSTLSVGVGGADILGDLLVYGNATLDGTLGVTGNATFSGNILAANFRDNTTSFYDNADPTKKFEFNASLIATGVTRTLSVPNASTTLVGRDNVIQNGAGAPLGYTTGAGGTVTQATSKATAVTLNTPTGRITMNNAALAGLTTVTFTLNNSLITTLDNLLIQHRSGGTLGGYRIEAYGFTNGAVTIAVTNMTAGTLSEAIALNYSIIAGAVT
jgi:hypothetical protein